MTTKFMFRVQHLLQSIENAFPILFGPKFPPGPLYLTNALPASISQSTPSSYTKSLKDLIGDGILWAVPKSRRTIERRLKRKYGSPGYVMKILLPKTNLRVCNQCGNDHEVGILCPCCYKKVLDETNLMQEKIQEELGLNPIEQDVIVLYDGEKNEQPSEFWKGKRIVEMKKQRPIWFSRNLIQKTTQPLATTKEVKPNDLG